MSIFSQQGDIASDMVFTMFSSHFEGARSPVFQEFSLESWCWTPATKKHLWESTFRDFLSKMCRNGYPEGGGESPKNLSFSSWVSFGVPWGAPGHQKEPQGPKMLPRDTKINVLGSKTASKMHNFLIGFRQILVSSESVRGLEMQKTRNPCSWNKKRCV